MFLNYCASKEAGMEIITSNHVMEGNSLRLVKKQRKRTFLVNYVEARQVQREEGGGQGTGKQWLML